MINNSYLLGLYGYGSTSAISTGVPSPVRKSQPTAPWAPEASKTAQSDLLRAALSGRRFINESLTSLDVKGKDSGDYRKIFAMYQGITMLEALATQASKTNLGTLERSQLGRRFEAGMAEMASYLSTLELGNVRLVEGTSETSAQTGAAVARASSLYKTGVVHTGSLTQEVEAFGGEVRFGIAITRGGVSQTVDIDLADMGSTPRTLGAVTQHINDRLTAAGFETRIGREQVETEPRTLKVGDKTITLPSAGDRWALNVHGSSVETVQFIPAARSDAVYVVQDGGGNQEMVKFQEGATYNPAGKPMWAEGQIGHAALPEGVKAVRASAVGPDGSVWMVADVEGGLTNQPIKGISDVVLMKLDSAGQLTMSRALGAADSASGYAIAIDDDGRVAVAGSVTGGLLPGGAVSDNNVADSFVTVFDATGQEQWTQRRGAKAADEATAVSFGEDGRVYVSGRAQSALSGTLAIGGWDGYVQAFSETQAHSLAPVVSSASGAVQFGTAGDDSVDAMTIAGDKLYTAGVENGSLVIRQFQLDPAGAPSLLNTRDLGSMAGGQIAGLSVVNGKVIVAGQTMNGALRVGQVTAAHNGGTDAFVAVLEQDLTSGPEESLIYYGGEGNDTAADVKIVDGKVWLTGVSNRPLGAKDEDPTQAYLTRLDPLSGAVEWSQTWTTTSGQATPTTLAVARGGGSVLDRLGLPQGELSQGDSQRLVDATTLRAGDRFYVKSGSTGREVAVTIEARDTLKTLATKIERASGNTLKVTIKTDRDHVTGLEDGERVTAGGVQRLSITFASDRPGATLRSGESGRDALAGLGLSPGFIGPASSDQKIIGMNLPRSLSLRDPESAKAAGESLAKTIKALFDTYKAMGPSASVPTAPAGTVSPYLQSQIANYQAALSRLGG